MAEEVGSLYYDLTIDDKTLKSKLANADKDVKSFGDRISDHFDKAANASRLVATGLAVAGAAAVGFGAVAVKAFSESQTVMAQTNAVLKSTGGVAGITAEQVTSLASALQKTTMFSDEVIQSGENLLLTFTKIGKDIFPEATEVMLDMSQALGQDVKSSAIQLGKALQDPILGVTALRRVGVNFSEAQQDVIKNLVETGRSAEAQRLILKELQTEFGGSAKAAGKTFAGQLMILKNSFDDVLEGIGAFIASGLGPLIDKFTEWIKQAGGAEGITNKLKDSLKFLADNMYLVAGVLTGALAPALIKAGISFATTFAPLLPWIAVGVALSLIVQTLVEKFGGWDNTLKILRETFAGVWQTMQNIASLIWERLQPSVMALWATIQTQLLPVLREFWQHHGQQILQALGFLVLMIGTAVISALWLFINVVNAVIQVFITWGHFTNWVQNQILGAFNRFKQGLLELRYFHDWFYGSIVGVWNGVYGFIRGIANAIGGAIIGPIASAFRWIIDHVGDVINALGRLNPFVRHSPSLVDLVTRGTEAITDRYGRMFNNISQMANGTSLQLSGGLAGGNRSDNRSYSSDINIGTIANRADADYLISRLDRSIELASFGGTPV